MSNLHNIANQEKDNPEAIIDALNRGVDPNEKDHYGRKALFYASKNNHLRMILILTQFTTLSDKERADINNLQLSAVVRSALNTDDLYKHLWDEYRTSLENMEIIFRDYYAPVTWGGISLPNRLRRILTGNPNRPYCQEAKEVSQILLDSDYMEPSYNQTIATLLKIDVAVKKTLKTKNINSTDPFICRYLFILKKLNLQDTIKHFDITEQFTQAKQHEESVTAIRHSEAKRELRCSLQLLHNKYNLDEKKFLNAIQNARNTGFKILAEKKGNNFKIDILGDDSYYNANDKQLYFPQVLIEMGDCLQKIIGMMGIIYKYDFLKMRLIVRSASEAKAKIIENFLEKAELFTCKRNEDIVSLTNQ